MIHLNSGVDINFVVKQLEGANSPTTLKLFHILLAHACKVNNEEAVEKMVTYLEGQNLSRNKLKYILMKRHGNKKTILTISSENGNKKICEDIIKLLRIYNRNNKSDLHQSVRNQAAKTSNIRASILEKESDGFFAKLKNRVSACLHLPPWFSVGVMLFVELFLLSHCLYIFDVYSDVRLYDELERYDPLQNISITLCNLNLSTVELNDQNNKYLTGYEEEDVKEMRKLAAKLTLGAILISVFVYAVSAIRSKPIWLPSVLNKKKGKYKNKFAKWTMRHDRNPNFDKV